MGKNLKNFSYIWRHRWYVFIECCKLGIIWRGIVHDLSKYRLSEWKPYTNHFFKFTDDGDHPDLPFDTAWLHHIHRNRHHWQYWIVREDNGDTKIMPMPDQYRKEMLADWIGAGRAIHGRLTIDGWYNENKHKMKLHLDTKVWIEKMIR